MTLQLFLISNVQQFEMWLPKNWYRPKEIVKRNIFIFVVESFQCKYEQEDNLKQGGDMTNLHWSTLVEGDEAHICLSGKLVRLWHAQTIHEV